MSTTSIRQLQERIDSVKRELARIGDMTPGSLSRQYNVCGTPTCRCKDPRHPVRHGPYYQLSYTRKGRSTTRFVRKEELCAVREQLANYARFRRLVERWIDAAMELSQLRREALKKARIRSPQRRRVR